MGSAARTRPSSFFAQQVLKIVRAIPRGKILTYGQVAILVGAPRAARAVGGVLFGLGPQSKVPWQRVINGEGGISTFRVGTGHLQTKLLKKEGVRFKKGLVEMKAHQWFPPPRLTEKWELSETLLDEFHRRLRL